MKKILSIIGFGLTAFAMAQDRNFEDVTMVVSPIKGPIYMIEGAGGNMGLCVGEDGAFLIDDQFAPLSDKIKSAVASITDKPIEFVINTHYHGDHSGGNEVFGAEGSVIVSHDKTRARILSAQEKKVENGDQDEIKTEALSKITFDQSMKFYFNGEEIELFFIANAHTDGDIIVHFKTSNVMHMGDLYVEYGWPYVDMNAGGYVQGMVDALQAALDRCDINTRFIPGHGQVARRDDLKTFQTMLSTVLVRVKEKVDAGASLEDINTDDMIAGYEGVEGNAKSFVKACFETLTK